MLTYRVNKRTILTIEAGVIEKMAKYYQKKDMNENGGILLGKARQDFSEYIITNISEPSNGDISGRYFFIRNKENAQLVVNDNWKQSEGEVNYLGEWHTHPALTPKPSFLDKRLLKRCLHENVYPFGGLFLIIVGSKGDIYVGFQTKRMGNHKKLEKLK